MEVLEHVADKRAFVAELAARLAPNGLLSGLSGPRTLHLDIVDYPGEWLLDLRTDTRRQRLAAIVGELDAFAGGEEPDDDQTLLVIGLG